MLRRDFLKAGLAASVLGGCGLDPRERIAGAGAPLGASPPNILVILVDEMRPPPGFPFGMPQVWQQNLQNMAFLWSKSACFANHFTAASDCSPSRATLVTGMYAHQHWLLTTKAGPSPSLQTAYPTYGNILSALGYATPWFGKWHLSDLAESCGADTLLPYGFSGGTCPDPIGTADQGAMVDQSIADSFLSWLGGAPTRTPWCATVSFVNPHDIQWFWNGSDCPPPNANAAALEEATPPSYGWDNAYFAQAYGGYPCNNFEDPRRPASPKPPMQLAFADFTDETWGPISWDLATLLPSMPPPDCSASSRPFNYWYKLLQLYLYVQSLVDAQIGRVLTALWGNPSFAGNTLVVFTSDHGEYGGAHGQRGKGGMAYDEGMRVPFSIYDPTGLYVASPGTVRTGLTSSVDFTPLLAALANGGKPPRWIGKTSYLSPRFDLCSMLADPAAPGRPWVLYSTDEALVGIPSSVASHVLGYRTAQGKLAVYSHWAQGTVAIDTTQRQDFELYDYTGNDTRELYNVWGQDALGPQYETQLLGANGQGGLAATEMQAPLDPTLQPAQGQAIAAYLAYAPPGPRF